MSRRTVESLTLSLQYTGPASESGSGALTANTGVSLTYWGETPTTGEQTTLLRTIVEEANEKTVYEGS